MTWVPRGEHQYCDRHETTFGKKETCPGCVTDPGPPIEQVERDVADPEAHADEAWCRAQRDLLIAIAKEVVRCQGQPTKPPKEPGADGEERDGWFFWRGTWRPLDPLRTADVGLSSIAKLADTALKFHRAAVEERRARGERDHERWLVRQYRELGLGRHGVAN